jgi:hypothetical protein
LKRILCKKTNKNRETEREAYIGTLHHQKSVSIYKAHQHTQMFLLLCSKRSEECRPNLPTPPGNTSSSNLSTIDKKMEGDAYQIMKSYKTMHLYIHVRLTIFVCLLTCMYTIPWKQISFHLSAYIYPSNFLYFIYFQ